MINGVITMLNDPEAKRALAAAFMLSVSSAPLGVFLVLRRMSLMGDVMAHAILPGIAAGFIMAGLSVSAMSLGGLIAGLSVALLAGLATRVSALREDASLTSFYLIAVALGVLMIALHGSAQELEDILFGDPKTITPDALKLMVGVTGVTLLTLGAIYRPLVVESFDPVFIRAVRGKGGVYHIVFLLLVVLNMIESYRALGTLMSAGLMLIPAITAQFWTRRLGAMIASATGIAYVCSLIGLGVASSYDLPSGPIIVLIAGGFYLVSLGFGRFGSVRARYFPFRHLQN